MRALKKRSKLLFCLSLVMLSACFGCHPQPDNGKNNQMGKKDGTAESQIEASETVNPPQEIENDNGTSSNNQAQVNPDQTSLAAQYPLLEHLKEQKTHLLANSRKVEKEIVPDGKYLNQKFASGRITLVLDEIDGEPAYFFSPMPGTDEEAQLEFLVYQYSNEELDKMIPGRKYQVHWLETIALMEPFEEGYHHCFVAYQIVEMK